MHLGLVGGIGPAATEYYYHHLTAAHAKADRPLELTIVQADIKVLLRNLLARDQAAQAEVYRYLATRLQAAGADVVAITSLGGHFCIEQFEAISPLPVVNAIKAVRAELLRRGVRSIGLLGTQAVMESQIYGGLTGFEVVPHGGDNLAAVGREYLAMARAAKVSEEQREFFFDAAHQLHRAGAEVILLAGTDLCLAFDGRPCDVPVLDCALVHAEALLELSLPAPPARA
ncbi:MAG: aspartate/glutamate racemase family protein [Acidobacteria bacterium]|nr:aspartate/glutamate racemase family protein [Acidobacteriota bacterium]